MVQWLGFGAFTEGARVPSLVGELKLRSHRSHGAAQKNPEKNIMDERGSIEWYMQSNLTPWRNERWPKIHKVAVSGL